MNKQVQSTLRQQHMLAILSSIFGLLALALCAVGLYGVLSYSVAQRTSEIGLRMALGAPRESIVALVLADSTRMLGIGIAAGLVIAVGATHLIRSMLFGVKPTDPGALLAGVMILVATALLAGYLPARRAARVDPMRALRQE